ncbi:hypothetical protein HRbin13_00030 [bacterium HR13]|nr:hypothetical protein HRbin13_00030 [bacterium HR13]
MEVANEQVRGKTNTLPAKEDTKQVVRQNYKEHGKEEQRQVSIELKSPLTKQVVHVAYRVNKDEGSHKSNHGGSDRRKSIKVKTKRHKGKKLI